jgi:3-oxoacyl-[acyl-carrier protein] reductase
MEEAAQVASSDTAATGEERVDLGLNRRVALVAGASRGIGAASARVLAAEGARVAVMARGREDLVALAKRIADAGGEAYPIVADIRSSAEANRAVAETLERFGRLDIVVASVGAAQGGIFWDIEDEVWEDALDTKFMGTVRLLRAAIRPMRSAGYGRIVVIVGNNGKQPHPRTLPGSAANAACLAVVKGLADEVAHAGIVVNALNPGPTRTGRWETLVRNLARQSGRSASDIEAEQLSRMPMGRIAEAEEMGRLVAVLSGELATMVTGTSVTADGGATKALA